MAFKANSSKQLNLFSVPLQWRPTEKKRDISALVMIAAPLRKAHGKPESNPSTQCNFCSLASSRKSFSAPSVAMGSGTSVL
jgi:hypothetical protein